MAIENTLHPLPDNRCGALDTDIPYFPEKYHRYVCSEINLDMSHDFSADGQEDVPHTIHLPVGVKTEDLPSIVARQSDMLAGKKLMAFGYQTIADLTRNDPEAGDYLLHLFSDRDTYQSFMALLELFDLNWQPHRDLDEAKVRFFPFSENNNTSLETTK